MRIASIVAAGLLLLTACTEDSDDTSSNPASNDGSAGDAQQPDQGDGGASGDPAGEGGMGEPQDGGGQGSEESDSGTTSMDGGQVGMDGGANPGEGGLPPACPPPPSGTPVTANEYDPPAGCSTDLGFGSFTQATLIENETEFQDFFSCLNSAPSGIDFGMNRLFAAVASERTEAELSYVVDMGDRIHVGIQSPVYCGGAAPPDTLVLVLLPAGATPVQQDALCTVGECVGPPAP